MIVMARAGPMVENTPSFAKRHAEERDRDGAG